MAFVCGILIGIIAGIMRMWIYIQRLAESGHIFTLNDSDHQVIWVCKIVPAPKEEGTDERD